MAESTDIRALVESKATDLEGLLTGSGLTLDRFKATVFQLWDRDSELRKCTPDSILSGVMAVADLGLTFTQNLGHAYLIKFGNSATPLIGYKGLMHLALQSGGALDFRAGVRHQADTWRFRPLHPTEPIEHEPAESSRGPIVGYYAVAFLPGGFVRGDYMTKAEIEAHRDKYSRAKDSGPWKSQFNDMAMKTVVRRVCKFLRLTGKLEKAANLGSIVDLDTGEVLDPLPDNLPPAPELNASGTPKLGKIDLSELAVNQGSDVIDSRKREPKLVLTPVVEIPDGPISTEQQDALLKLARSKGISTYAFCQWLVPRFKVDDPGDLVNSQLMAVKEALAQQGD